MDDIIMPAGIKTRQGLTRYDFGRCPIPRVLQIPKPNLADLILFSSSNPSQHGLIFNILHQPPGSIINTSSIVISYSKSFINAMFTYGIMVFQILDVQRHLHELISNSPSDSGYD